MTADIDALDIITTSERNSFKRCPQRWWWAYREGLTPKQMSDAYWFGIAIHLALAELYRLGYKRSVKKAMDAFIDFVDNDDMSRVIRTFTDGTVDNDKWVAARDLGIGMLNGYIEKYGKDPDWDVIYTEHPFRIIIPHPDDKRRDIAMFTSTFDGVYRDKWSRKIYLMEHKTAKQISTGHLAMDDQGGAYWAVATDVLRNEGILASKEVIAGITYNFLRKALPDDRARDEYGYALNKDGSRSKNQPAPFFHREEVLRTQSQRRRQILNIGNEVKAMQLMKAGDLKPWKTPDRMNCPGCPFYNMCELDDLGQPVEEFRNAMFTIVNPYDRYDGLKSAAA